MAILKPMQELRYSIEYYYQAYYYCMLSMDAATLLGYSIVFEAQCYEGTLKWLHLL